MKINYILLISLLIVGIFIPAVSAEIIIDEQIGGWIDTSGRHTLKFEMYDRASLDMKYIAIRDISLAQTLNFVTLTVSGNKGSLGTGQYPITYTLGGVTKNGLLYVTKYNNVIGQVTHTRFQLFFYDWDIGNLQGPQIITLNRGLWKTSYYGKFYWPTTSIDSNIIFGCNLYNNNIFWTTHESMDTVYVSGIDWNNHLIVTHNNDASYKVDLKRLINGKNYASTLTVRDISDSVTYTVYGNDDVSQFFYSDEISTISVISPSNDEYTYNIDAAVVDPGTPSKQNVNIYLFDSETEESLTGVQVKIYQSLPDLSLGSLIRTVSLDSGDTVQLSDGRYYLSATKAGYTQQYAITETPIIVDGAYISAMPIWMRPDHSPDQHSVSIHVLDFQTEEPLSLVNIEIYKQDGESLGDLVKNSIITSGDRILLPDGNYYVSATKSGYTQQFPPTQTKIVVDGAYISVPPIWMHKEVPDTYKPVNLYVVDIDTERMLSDINVKIYNLTNNHELGDIFTTARINSGDTIHLPEGNYAVSAEKSGYIQKYPVIDTRIEVTSSLVSAPPIWMKKYTPVGSYPVNIHILDYDTESPLSNVDVKIYKGLPGNLVSSSSLNSGDTIYLSAGNYYIEAKKSGYTQKFSVSETVIQIDSSGNVFASPVWMEKDVIPTPGIPGVDPDKGFLEQACDSLARLFGVSYDIGKLLMGMLLALAIGMTVSKNLNNSPEAFGFGLLGGSMLSCVIGLLPIWIFVVLILTVGLYIGQRYMRGGTNG